MSVASGRTGVWLAAALVASSLQSTSAGEQPPRPPQVWAIVVGIDQYQDKTIPACSGAIADARELRQWLVRIAGWNARNVLLLQDAGAELPGQGPDQLADLKPTRENLEWAFSTWLKSRLEPGDLVLFAFAGQAAALKPAANAPLGTATRASLLPIDAQATDLAGTGWSLERSLDAFASSGRNPVICWLDTSLLGRGDHPQPIPGTDPDASAGRWLSSLARWPGVSVWLAADLHSAAEGTQLSERSPFARAVFQALGTPRQPANLLSCLDHLNRDRPLRKQGFRSMGGISPDLSLWSTSVRRLTVPERTLLLQRGHADRVEALAFTADGSRMVSASDDSTVKLWRVADRALLRTLPGYFHSAGVTSLSLSRSGQWLASGDGSGRVRVWDLVAQREHALTGPPPHNNRVLSLAFLADGAHFVSVDQDGKAWLWDVSGPTLTSQPLASALGALACAAEPGPVVLALASESGPIRLLDADGAAQSGPDGKPQTGIPGPGKTITTLALAPDGSHLAASDDDGRVEVWEIATHKRIFQHNFEGEVNLLAVSPGPSLAVSAGDGVYFASLNGSGGVARLDASEPARQLLFSSDGTLLAACSRRTGTIQVWKVDDHGKHESISLSGVQNSSIAAVSLAFAPGSRALVAGGQDGGLRFWTMPGGERGGEVAPRRGKVAALGASRDGRFLLEITRDWSALLWDLSEGRGFLPLPGLWTSGVIAPDGSRMFLTAEATGDVVVLDRSTGARLATLSRPDARAGRGLTTWRFGARNLTDGDQMLAISRDGRWVAACSAEGPLACVWDAATNRLVHAVQDPDQTQPLTAIDFSSDAQLLLTADASGTAKLWDLHGPDLRPAATATFNLNDTALSAARISPADPHLISVGTRDGRVLLWNAGNDQPFATPVRIQGQVRSLTFSPDGRWLCAGGSDKSVWRVSLAEPRSAERLDTAHPHAEQVNTLVASLGEGILVSGSDDTTVRFWNLADRRLLGVLSAGQEPAEEEGGGSLSLDTSWVAYTPEGLFDCAPGAERQVTWLLGEEVLSFEQFAATSRLFGLADLLRQGRQPPRPKLEEVQPPRLAIDPPAELMVRGAAPRIELTITLAEESLTELRLYHNGIPVLTSEDLPLQPGRRQL
ncbi:MAG TPA: WD40 repeat domain-containing protein, partial [Isosphaeraceae bacterium]|nr:WD40 repeat domain-containing protein [Isosphaeraceae bacterium]